MNTDQTDENIEIFQKHVEDVTAQNGVSFIMGSESHVINPTSNDLVNGYFTEFPQKQLAVAMGKPRELWLPVLAHEFCHLQQYLDKSPEYINAYIPHSTIEAGTIVELWMQERLELTAAQLNEYIQRARNVELYCERRTVDVITEFNLPINTTEYIQKANSYIFFYTAMKETKSWYLPGKEPYNSEHVWSLCPTHFLNDEEYEKVSPELMEAYKTIL